MKYIIANWKMNLNLTAVNLWLADFEKTLPELNTTNELILAPSAPYLHVLKSSTKNYHNISLAGQDVSIFDKGAHTGEIGVYQLKDYCKYCLIGHSERKESTKTVMEKRDKCLAAGIVPIVCFVDIENLQTLNKAGVILAWEDPQNISVEGQYRPKDPAEIEAAITKIRNVVGADAPLVYGGSVNRQNAPSLAKMDKLDGVLVGNASNDPSHFSDIIKEF